MIAQLLIAWGLMGLCVAIHAAGMVRALRWLRRAADSAQGFWSSSWLFIRIAGGDRAVSPRRDLRMGLVLLLEGSNARCGIGPLFQHRYLHHDWLRRPGFAGKVATDWRSRGPHRNPDVRLVHGIFLCRR